MNNGHLPGKFIQRCPKQLSKQAGDRFALEILKNSIEPISKGLSNEFVDPEVGPEIINYLKKLKSWYWEQTSEFLGHGSSKPRRMISSSFMDLLDVRKKFRKCKVLQRYIIQMLFCCEVGNFERPQEMILNKEVSGHVTEFIEKLGPFYFETLYDTYLKFNSDKVLRTLLGQSRELKVIHLRHSISSTRFPTLARCRKLEVVTIDVENAYNESFDVLRELLLRTFFGNEGRGVADFGYLTFPHLKAVCIRCDKFPVELFDILFLLQQCPNIITQLTCLISLPFNTLQKVSPFVCPTMLVGKDADCKSVEMYLRTPVPGGCITRLENSMEVASSIMKFNQNFASSVRNIQNSLGLIESVESLRYIYFNQGMVVVSTAGGVIGHDLVELHVFGKLAADEEVQNLVRVLNSCPRLQVLCLQLEITTEPSMRHLNLMDHLQNLSVSLKWFSQRSKSNSRKDRPLDPQSVSFISSLIRAAPNINVLEIPGKSNLLSALQPDLLSEVRTLILMDGDVDGGKYFVMSLPSLSVLVLSTDSDYKKYQKIKKAFRRMQLEVFSRNTRAVFPVIL